MAVAAVIFVILVKSIWPVSTGGRDGSISMDREEERQITLLMTLSGIIGVIGVLLIAVIPNLTFLDTVRVENYTARIHLDGNIEETFVYEITEPGKYRMLYRNWEMALYGPFEPWESGRRSFPFMEVMNISAPEGTIRYVKDAVSGVRLVSKPDDPAGLINYFISSKALDNEAGAYLPSFFDAGTYRMDYVFRIHPPLECDGEYCHLNLKLASEHLRYSSLSITVHDSDGLIERVFTHPLMNARREEEAWVIRGSSQKNDLLEVELLLKPEVMNRMDAFQERIDDVERKTVSANMLFSTASMVIGVASYALVALALLFPLIILAFYNACGKEKSFVVPKTLSYVPKSRKPWLVNLVFKGDPFKFDGNALYATLLDLKRRGIIELDEKSGSLRITVLEKDAGDDLYEKRVMKLLTDFAGADGVFDADEFEGRIAALSGKGAFGQAEARMIMKTMDDLMKTPNPYDAAAAEEFVSRGKKRVWLIITPALLALCAAFCGFKYYGTVFPALKPCFYASMVLVLQSVPLLFTSSALFGKWKQDHYKEKLEWLAFRRFLSDFAMIKKYAPEDLNIWKEWLVYGTALGVGDKVAEAMEKLNVHMPDAAMATEYLPLAFISAYSLASSAASPSSGGGSGGGGGGGGGFGGGGGCGGGGGGAR